MNLIREINLTRVLTLAIVAVGLCLCLAFAAPQRSEAGTRADCNARAEADNCKKAVDNRCDGKSGDEREKCIDTVLSEFVITGLGAGGVQNCPAGSTGNRCLTTLPKVNDSPGQIRSALALAFGIAAGVAIIALLVAAFNYATAGTDIEKAARSKRSIITALMGLVIALSAEALVLTVLNKI